MAGFDPWIASARNGFGTGGGEVIAKQGGAPSERARIQIAAGATNGGASLTRSCGFVSDFRGNV